MRRVLVIGCALLLGGAASSARAQLSTTGNGAPSPRWISFGIGGGVSVPVSDVKSALDNGFAGQGFIRFGPPGTPFAARLDFTFQSFDLKSVKTSSSASTTTQGGTSQVFGGLAQMQFDLMHGPIRPYLLAGIGAYNVNVNPDDPSIASTSDTRFGINGGAGLAMQVSVIRLYIEGRVDNVYTQEGLIDANSIKTIPVTFGIAY